MKTILIIGDSLVRGVGATNNHGWAQIVAGTFPAVDFDIQGESGDTVDKVCDRWPAKAYDLVILQIGTNDCCIRHSKGGPQTSSDRFTKQLARIQQRFQAPATAKLLLIGLFGVDEAKTMPLSPDKTYTNIAINQYDVILRKFARRHDIAFAPLRGIRPIKVKWLPDGVHPNDAGHAWIASHVVMALRKRFGLEARAASSVEG